VVIKLNVRKILQGKPRQKIVTRTLTSDLFVVADLFVLNVLL